VQLPVLVVSLQIGAHAAPLNIADGGDPGGAPLPGGEQPGWQVRAERQASPTNGHEAADAADVGSFLINPFASWSPCSPCRTCYSAPNICSSKPWWQLSLPGRINDEQWNLFSPEF
jgi:hypothetical protein